MKFVKITGHDKEFKRIEVSLTIENTQICTEVWVNSDGTSVDFAKNEEHYLCETILHIIKSKTKDLDIVKKEKEDKIRFLQDQIDSLK